VTTDEKLEKAIETDPRRYVAYRNKDKSLNKVMDTATGRLWLKVQNQLTKESKWSWIE